MVRIAGRVPRVRQHLIDRAGEHQRGAIRARVSAAGRVTSATALDNKLPAEINRAFIAAIRQWRYRPYRVDGRAVPVCFAVSFRLGR